jgi:hypothetical protein
MLYFQFGLYQDITVGLQNCKVLVVCVSDEVSGSKLGRSVVISGYSGFFRQ